MWLLEYIFSFVFQIFSIFFFQPSIYCNKKWKDNFTILNLDIFRIPFFYNITLFIIFLIVSDTLERTRCIVYIVFSLDTSPSYSFYLIFVRLIWLIDIIHAFLYGNSSSYEDTCNALHFCKILYKNRRICGNRRSVL